MSEEFRQPFYSALKFAAHRHRFSKTKNEEPYINHLINVCSLLYDTGDIGDVQILTAGILHDILEKTNTKIHELQSLFGEKIAHWVVELTDVGYASEKEKWQYQLNKIHTLSHEARLIKLSDKIENVRSILAFPPKGWDIERRAIYIDWTEKIIHAMQGTNDKLELYFNSLIQEVKRTNPMIK